MIEAIGNLIAHYGYAAIFVLLVLGIVGLPVSDETLLTFTGYLVFRGQLKLVPAFLSALLGSGCGITISYQLGRIFGGTGRGPGGGVGSEIGSPGSPRGAAAQASLKRSPKKFLPVHRLSSSFINH